MLVIVVLDEQQDSGVLGHRSQRYVHKRRHLMSQLAQDC
jgi:hypothetical protein